MKFIVVLATLCFITWINPAQAMHGPVSSCCPGWSTTRVPLTEIKNYTIQSEGVCPVTAVVFQTKVGIRICSNPNSKWAKKAIVKVDEEAKRLLEMEQMTQASTSDFASTVPTITTRAWMNPAQAMHGPVSSCCPGWSTTRVPLTKIQSYTIQSEGVCPVTAVVFQTKVGIRICSNPNSEWAKKAIVKVDEEAEGLLEMEKMAQASTSDFASTVSTITTKAWMNPAQAMHGPVSSCCSGWSTTRVPLTEIQNYTIQSEGVCPVTAVVFQTKVGNRICSNTNSEWAKKAIVKVDEEAKRLLEMEQMAQASTSDFTSTVSTITTKAWMNPAQAMHGPVSSCCPGLSTTRVPLTEIQNYTIQSEGVCPLTAVVFQTKAGNRICSNPNSEWAKTAIVKVDEEAKGLLEMEQMAQASTSDFASTVSTTKTTTKKAPRKKDMSRRWRLRKMFRRRRIRLRKRSNRSLALQH